jgi:hypothetical protein
MSVSRFPLGERFRIGASLTPPFALLWLASRRGWVPFNSWWCLAALPGALLLGMLWPQAFAGWHRGFSAAQAWLGRRIFMGLLGLVFIFVLAPFGWILRRSGRSFLEGPPADSYWKPARPPGSLRDQF